MLVFCFTGRGFHQFVSLCFYSPQKPFKSFHLIKNNSSSLINFISRDLIKKFSHNHKIIAVYLSCSPMSRFDRSHSRTQCNVSSCQLSKGDMSFFSPELVYPAFGYWNSHCHIFARNLAPSFGMRIWYHHISSYFHLLTSNYETATSLHWKFSGPRWSDSEPHDFEITSIWWPKSLTKVSR